MSNQQQLAGLQIEHTRTFLRGSKMASVSTLFTSVLSVWALLNLYLMSIALAALLYPQMKQEISNKTSDPDSLSFLCVK